MSDRSRRARHAYDDLRGLKENVIIGKVIPVGTGFRPDRAIRRTRVWGSAALDTGGDFDGEMGVSEEDQEYEEEEEYEYKDDLEDLTEEES